MEFLTLFCRILANEVANTSKHDLAVELSPLIEMLYFQYLSSHPQIESNYDVLLEYFAAIGCAPSPEKWIAASLGDEAVKDCLKSTSKMDKFAPLIDDAFVQTAARSVRQVLATSTGSSDGPTKAKGPLAIGIFRILAALRPYCSIIEESADWAHACEFASRSQLPEVAQCFQQWSLLDSDSESDSEIFDGEHETNSHAGDVGVGQAEASSALVLEAAHPSPSDQGDTTAPPLGPALYAPPAAQADLPDRPPAVPAILPASSHSSGNLPLPRCTWWLSGDPTVTCFPPQQGPGLASVSTFWVCGLDNI